MDTYINTYISPVQTPTPYFGTLLAKNLKTAPSSFDAGPQRTCQPPYRFRPPATPSRPPPRLHRRWVHPAPPLPLPRPHFLADVVVVVVADHRQVGPPSTLRGPPLRTTTAKTVLFFKRQTRKRGRTHIGGGGGGRKLRLPRER